MSWCTQVEPLEASRRGGQPWHGVVCSHDTALWYAAMMQRRGMVDGMVRGMQHGMVRGMERGAVGGMVGG